MKIYITLTFCLFIALLPLSGQIAAPPSPVSEQFRNDISPQVEMMNRYGTYPVNLSTGLVDISIPLYTVTTPDGLSVPLNISFHASGLRSTEREGVLGVRWALGGTGAISRTIKGYPDYIGYSVNGERRFNTKVSVPHYKPDFYDLYGTTGPQNVHMDGSNSAFLDGVTDSNLNLDLHPGEYKDTEHDIYSYSLPSGKNGKFIWRQETESDNDEIWKGYTMPYEPIQVAPARIIDEDGVTYQFGEGIFVDKDRDLNITTRYLTSIVSQNKKDKITIDYVRCGSTVHTGRQYAVINGNAHGPTYVDLGSETTVCDALEHPLSLGLSRLLLWGYYNEEYEMGNGEQDIPYSIHSIHVYSEGRLTCTVEFDYGSGLRKDSYLKEIIVKNALGTIIKDIKFAVKFNREDVKFLDKLSFVDPTTQDAKETYTFDYYNWKNMPSCGSDQLRNNFDWWGFYSDGGGWMHSGEISVDTPLGKRSHTIFNGDKIARPESMETGMIKSICYPTGGTTTFEYEGNKAAGLSNKEITMGGLRICNLINLHPSGKTETKHYEYAQGAVSHYLIPPVSNLINANEIFVDCYAHMECQRYPNYFPASNDEAGDYRRIVYQGYFPDSYTAFSSNIVDYNKVTEYNIENSGSTERILGKTVYEYSYPINYSRKLYEDLNGDEFYPYQPPYISPADFWIGGKLLSKTYYEGERKKKEIIYDYNIYRKKSIYDLPVYRYRHHFVDIRSVNSSNDKWKRDKRELSMIYPYSVNETFAIVHQEYTIGAEKLVRETENTYLDNDTIISTVKEIEYDSDYLLPIKEVVTNSDFTRQETKYAYPFSSPYSGSLISRWMLSENINYLPLFEKQVYKDSVLLNKITTTYAYTKVSDGFFKAKIQDAVWNTTIAYEKYTAAQRPVYITQNDASEKIIYLWSYYQQYPVAEILNATYDEICNALGGESFITELADKMVPASTDYAKIRNLRTVLPDVQITTAEYQPLVGVTKTIDPKGMATYYEYDVMGRLAHSYIIQNGNRQTIERYDYHHVNK